MSAAEAFSSDGGFWRRVFDQSSAPMAIMDLRGRYEHVNPAACTLLGYSVAQLRGLDYRDVTHPDDVDPSGPVAADVPLEKRYVRADGGIIWALVSRAYIRDEAGTPIRLVSQIQDITQRRGLEVLWQRSFANAPIGMAMLDVHETWLEVNDELCSILGYQRDDLVGKSVLDIAYEPDRTKGDAEVAELLAGRQDTVTIQKRYRRRNGRPIWMFIRLTAVPQADGSPAFLVGQYESIGNRRLVDAHLARLALHDPLTGLANRVLVEDRLNQDLKQVAGGGSGVLAVLVADIDRLKPINDQYGHAQGDQLLMAAAQLLEKAVRSGDTVGRIGGDEFVVVSLLAHEQAAHALRDRVTTSLAADVTALGVRMEVRASVGLAVTDDARTPVDDLLDRADRDMYERKWSRRVE